MKNIDAIFIEAGHGRKTIFGFDMGASAKLGSDTFYERTLTKELGGKLLPLLASKTKCPIYLVAVATDGATLAEKTKYINGVIKQNGYKNCLAVALHFNSVVGSSASGTEIFYQQKKPITFARAIADAFAKYKIFPMRSPDIKSSATYSDGGLYIDDWNATSVLIESCFISSPSDLKTLLLSKDRLAECIANGMLNFIRS